MFRVAPLLRRISPFSLFLMDQKNNPSLAGLPGIKRAKLLSKMFKTLPQKKRANLERRAIKHPSFGLKRKNLKKVSFKEYAALHKNKVQALHPSKQMDALSKMFNLKKAVVISGRKGKKTTLYPCKDLEQTVKAKLKKYEQRPLRAPQSSSSKRAGEGKLCVASARAKVKSKVEKPRRNPRLMDTSKKKSAVGLRNPRKRVVTASNSNFFLRYLKASGPPKKGKASAPTPFSRTKGNRKRNIPPKSSSSHMQWKAKTTSPSKGNNTAKTGKLDPFFLMQLRKKNRDSSVNLAKTMASALVKNNLRKKHPFSIP